MAWGGPSSVLLGSILYFVFTATESSMTCVKSCENCFQVVCRVGRGTRAEAWVWVGKHKGKRSYKTRTWALEDRWTSEHYKSAGLVQGSMKTTGGSLHGKSPLTKPLHPCGSGQSKETQRENACLKFEPKVTLAEGQKDRHILIYLDAWWNRPNRIDLLKGLGN